MKQTQVRQGGRVAVGMPAGAERRRVVGATGGVVAARASDAPAAGAAVVGGASISRQLERCQSQRGNHRAAAVDEGVGERDAYAVTVAEAAASNALS